jgi:hypothetical protein
MMDLKLSKTDDGITITFDSLPYPLNGFCSTFYMEVPDKVKRILFHDFMKDAIWDSLKKIKAEAYIEGYHDGRAKYAIQRHFSGMFSCDVIGTRNDK